MKSSFRSGVVPWTTELVSGKIHTPHGDENLADITFLAFTCHVCFGPSDPCRFAPTIYIYIYTHMCHGQNMGAGQAGPQSGFQTSWLYQPKLL